MENQDVRKILNPTQHIVIHFLSALGVSSTMPKSRQQIIDAVKRKLSPKTLSHVLTFVEAKHPKLWGEKRPQGFQKTCIYLALYKELYGKSIRKLRKKVKVWWSYPRKTLGHNQQVIQRLLDKWGRKQVQCGSIDDWKRAVQHWDMPLTLKGTNLWIDSLDLQIKGKSRVKKKSRKWSYKLDAPGRRYMFVFDGNGRVRKWCGGVLSQNI